MTKKLLLLLAGVLTSLQASAHVKWFSMMADCASAPVTTLNLISSPLFAALAVAAFAAMFGVAAIDMRISQGDNILARTAARVDLEAADLFAPLLRIGVAIYFVCVVVYFWGSPIILTVDLKTNATWVPMLQLAIAATILRRRTAILAAVGLVVLFAYAVSVYGMFHMLDYPFFLGLAAFLVADSIYGRKARSAGLAVLRITVGLSLLWCGVEKWLYPDWTIELLQTDLRVLLKTGLEPTFIVMSAGFVEFCLAFVLMFGRLASQIAAVTLLSVMISAVPVVGILDLIGHLPLLVVLVILAASRNAIGRLAVESAKRRSDVKATVSFIVSVPGFIAAYYLGHEMAYGSLDKLNWTEGLLAGALLVLLVVEVVRTAPETFRHLYRLDEPVA
ncbi:MAG TPA: hypothetical protein VN649_05250 [Ramlibacter sp.]|nr:hypothetical protein [Ramlibacter sp.]